MISPVTLEGLSVRLVPLTLADADRLCVIGLDPRLWQATTIQIQTREEMESYVRAALEAQSAGTALPFVIVERATDQIVGATRYHSAVSEHKRIEIGFTWISLPWQRTVVNTEAKYLMLKYAFESLRCIRVEFKSSIANEQSRRALARIGAKQEGILRSYRVVPDGGALDLVLFSIVASEWLQVRTDLEAKLKRPPNQAL